MHRVAELLCRRRGRIVGTEVGVVRPIAIGAPIALHLAGVGVDHRHALVEIAVGDVGLVGLGIDPNLRDAAEILEIIAARVLAGDADKYDWQRWTGSVKLPSDGYYEIWARATNSRGIMQPHLAGSWNPQGYGGNPMHRVAVLIG